MKETPASKVKLLFSAFCANYEFIYAFLQLLVFLKLQILIL